MARWVVRVEVVCGEVCSGGDRRGHELTTW